MYGILLQCSMTVYVYMQAQLRDEHCIWVHVNAVIMKEWYSLC